MTWEEALYMIENRVNGVEEDPEEKPYWDLRVYADVSSNPMGLKVSYKKASEEEWHSLGVLVVESSGVEAAD